MMFVQKLFNSNKSKTQTKAQNSPTQNFIGHYFFKNYCIEQNKNVAW